MKKYLWDEGRSSAEAAVIIIPNGKSIHEAYQWRVDFVDELVDPADEYAAEQISMAVKGRLPDLHQNSAPACGCAVL